MEVENAPGVPEGEGRLFLYLLLSLDGTHFLRKTGFSSGASFKKITRATKTISGWTSDVFCRIVWWGYLDTACQFSRNLAYGKCPNGKTITYRL